MSTKPVQFKNPEKHQLRRQWGLKPGYDTVLQRFIDLTPHIGNHFKPQALLFTRCCIMNVSNRRHGFIINPYQSFPFSLLTNDGLINLLTALFNDLADWSWNVLSEWLCNLQFDWMTSSVTVWKTRYVRAYLCGKWITSWWAMRLWFEASGYLHTVIALTVHPLLDGH